MYINVYSAFHVLFWSLATSSHSMLSSFMEKQQKKKKRKVIWVWIIMCASNVMTVFIYGWNICLIWYVKPNVLSKSLWCHLNTSTSSFEVKPQKNRENKPSVSVNSCYLLAVSHRIALQSVEWPFCGHNMSRPALCARFQRCQALLHAGKIERVRVMGWNNVTLTHVCLFRLWHSAASREVSEQSLTSVSHVLFLKLERMSRRARKYAACSYV